MRRKLTFCVVVFINQPNILFAFPHVASKFKTKAPVENIFMALKYLQLVEFSSAVIFVVLQFYILGTASWKINKMLIIFWWIDFKIPIWSLLYAFHNTGPSCIPFTLYLLYVKSFFIKFFSCCSMMLYICFISVIFLMVYPFWFCLSYIYLTWYIVCLFKMHQVLDFFHYTLELKLPLDPQVGCLTCCKI